MIQKSYNFLDMKKDSNLKKFLDEDGFNIIYEKSLCYCLQKFKNLMI